MPLPVHRFSRAKNLQSPIPAHNDGDVRILPEVTSRTQLSASPVTPKAAAMASTASSFVAGENHRLLVVKAAAFATDTTSKPSCRNLSAAFQQAGNTSPV